MWFMGQYIRSSLSPSGLTSYGRWL